MSKEFAAIIPAGLGTQLSKAVTGLTAANDKCKKLTDADAYGKCISDQYGALAKKFTGDNAVVGNLINMLKDNWSKDVAACAETPATQEDCSSKAAQKVIQSLFKLLAGVFTSSLTGGQ